jgi:hypothetical protein
MTGAVWAIPPREHDWDQVGVTELRASLRVKSMRGERVLRRGLTVRAIASSSILRNKRRTGTCNPGSAMAHGLTFCVNSLDCRGKCLI